MLIFFGSIIRLLTENISEKRQVVKMTQLQQRQTMLEGKDQLRCSR